MPKRTVCARAIMIQSAFTIRCYQLPIIQARMYLALIMARQRVQRGAARRSRICYYATVPAERTLCRMTYRPPRALARTNICPHRTQGKLSGTRPYWYHAVETFTTVLPLSPADLSAYLQLGEGKVVQTYGLRRLSILIFVRGVRMDVSAWPLFTLYEVKYSV